MTLRHIPTTEQLDAMDAMVLADPPTEEYVSAVIEPLMAATFIARLDATDVAAVGCGYLAGLVVSEDIHAQQLADRDALYRALQSELARAQAWKYDPKVQAEIESIKRRIASGIGGVAHGQDCRFLLAQMEETHGGF